MYELVQGHRGEVIRDRWSLWLKELDGLHENHDGPPEVV